MIFLLFFFLHKWKGVNVELFNSSNFNAFLVFLNNSLLFFNYLINYKSNKYFIWFKISFKTFFSILFIPFLFLIKIPIKNITINIQKISFFWFFSYLNLHSFGSSFYFTKILGLNHSFFEPIKHQFINRFSLIIMKQFMSSFWNDLKCFVFTSNMIKKPSCMRRGC